MNFNLKKISIKILMNHKMYIIEKRNQLEQISQKSMMSLRKI